MAWRGPTTRPSSPPSAARPRRPRPHASTPRDRSLPRAAASRPPSPLPPPRSLHAASGSDDGVPGDGGRGDGASHGAPRCQRAGVLRAFPGSSKWQVVKLQLDPANTDSFWCTDGPSILSGWLQEFAPGSNGKMTTMGVYVRDLLLGQIANVGVWNELAAKAKAGKEDGSSRCEAPPDLPSNVNLVENVVYTDTVPTYVPTPLSSKIRYCIGGSCC